MKTASNSPLLPLPLEVVQRQGRKAFICPPAATTITNEQVAVLDSDLLSSAISPSYFVQGTLAVFVIYSETGAQLYGLTVRCVAVGVCSGFFPLEQSLNIRKSLDRD